MDEHAAALVKVQKPAMDIRDLPAQYEYLKFFMENYPGAVMEYLSQEPEHFKGLAQQSTDIGMALYVHAVAEKIFSYSIMGKIVARAVEKYKPIDGTADDVLHQLLDLSEGESQS
jgi:hypothetical protein